MCGIVAVIAKRQYGLDIYDQELFRNLLVCDYVRGTDSTGIFGVSKEGDVSLFKEIGHPFNILTSPEFISFGKKSIGNLKILVGHNRAATKGVVSAENAHPFHEGNTILVHNGTLYNHKELKDVDVDSHAIVHAIEERGYKEAIESLDGAFALIWYDINTGELYVARNKERPLHVVETSYGYIVASEKNMLSWLTNRSSFGYAFTNSNIPKEFEEGQIYKLSSQSTGEVSFTKEPFSAKKTFSPPSTTIIGGGMATAWTNPQQQPYKDQKSPEKSSLILFSPETIDDFSAMFQLGSTISFSLRDYRMYEDGKGFGNYKGEITGVHCHNENIEVTCHHRLEESQVLELLEYDYVNARLSSTAWKTNPRVARLICSTPSGEQYFYTKNQLKVTTELWNRLNSHGHCKCGRCHTHIRPGHLPETFIKLHKEGRVVIRCKTCLEEYQKKGKGNK